MSFGPIYGMHHRPTFAHSVVKLVGHVLGGAILFISLAAVSWAIGLGIEGLNGIHPFNKSVLSLLHGVEVAILYLDVALSGIVLLVGAFRFIKEIAGVRP